MFLQYKNNISVKKNFKKKHRAERLKLKTENHTGRAEHVVNLLPTIWFPTAFNNVSLLLPISLSKSHWKDSSNLKSEFLRGNGMERNLMIPSNNNLLCCRSGSLCVSRCGGLMLLEKL
ncbi:hypothetical protein GmHk_01G002829 [Glycine max]|nr:hypothetical protein GmHk_01G002829 [Glycine max]